MANVVITGSSKGIGFGLAREFANRGHNVMLSGSSDASISAALEKLEADNTSGQIQGRACDVRKAADLQTLWDTASSAFGSVDIWINNAGLARTTWPVSRRRWAPGSGPPRTSRPPSP